MKKILLSVVVLLLFVAVPVRANHVRVLRIIAPQNGDLVVRGSQVELKWYPNYSLVNPNGKKKFETPPLVNLALDLAIYQGDKLSLVWQGEVAAGINNSGNFIFSIVPDKPPYTIYTVDSGIYVPEKVVFAEIFLSSWWSGIFNWDSVIVLEIDPLPVIEYLTPSDGPAGTEFTIHGKGFDRFNNTVKVSGAYGFETIIKGVASNGTGFDEKSSNDDGTEIVLKAFEVHGLTPGAYTISVVDNDWVEQYIPVPESFRRSNPVTFVVLSAEEWRVRNLPKATARAEIESVAVSLSTDGVRTLVLRGSDFSLRENTVVLEWGFERPADATRSGQEFVARSGDGTTIAFPLPADAEEGEYSVYVVNDAGLGPSDRILFTLSAEVEEVVQAVEEPKIEVVALSASEAGGGTLVTATVTGLAGNPAIRFVGANGVSVVASSNFDGASTVRFIVPLLPAGQYTFRMESPTQGLMSDPVSFTVLR